VWPAQSGQIRERNPQPLKDGLRDHKLAKDAGELAGEDLLARVWLRALSAVTGAVVVQILALFQLTDQEAAAVAALHHPRESEIVLHLPGLVLRSRIQ
jgi:hypothetical protein